MSAGKSMWFFIIMAIVFLIIYFAYPVEREFYYRGQSAKFKYWNFSNCDLAEESCLRDLEENLVGRDFDEFLLFALGRAGYLFAKKSRYDILYNKKNNITVFDQDYDQVMYFTKKISPRILSVIDKENLFQSETKSYAIHSNKGKVVRLFESKVGE